jgi:hypothetical protein
MISDYRHALDKGQVTVREFLHGSSTGYQFNDWQRYMHAKPREAVVTAISAEDAW